MVQMRWHKYYGDSKPAVHIGGYPECPFHYVLQYREVVERDESGEVVLATVWQDVETDDS